MLTLKPLRSLIVLAGLICISGICVRAQQPAPPPSPPRPDWSAPASQPSEPGQKAPPAQNPSDAAQASQNKVPPIVSTTGLVHLVATVTDRRHNFVTDLEQSDFKILEDNTCLLYTSRCV